jgi:hypothetical protein
MSLLASPSMTNLTTLRWAVSTERVDRFAHRFSNAPFIEASLWRGCGHNIEHHRLSEA